MEGKCPLYYIFLFLRIFRAGLYIYGISKALKPLLSACRFRTLFQNAEGENDSSLFRSMATIDMIRRSDGRTYYPCGTLPYPPTNPKAGTPTSGNTVIWSERTHRTTLVVPRINPVNVDSWSPRSSRSNYSGPVTYSKPPRPGVNSASDVRKQAPNDSCPPVTLDGKALCGK